MNLRFIILLILLSECYTIPAQNTIEIEANFNIENRIISIDQTIEYQNTSNDTLNEIYLNDWNNSYSTKKTPLAERFTEEFDNRFHFAKSEDRGYTNITSLKLENQEVPYQYVEGHPDVIKINLPSPLLPYESYSLDLTYNLRMPKSSFTDYGINDQNDIYLKYWYITPAVYDGEWQYFSNKNLDDLYVPVSDITIKARYPFYYSIFSELNIVEEELIGINRIVVLKGSDRINTTFILKQKPDFSFINTDDFTIWTNINESGVENHEKAIIVDRITSFIERHLDDYPHEKMLITTTDYSKDPLYGLNQLPSFLRPFSDSFQYELKILKTALKNYLDNTILTNPRRDYWLHDGLQIYFLIKYIEEFYPDKKLLGSLADVWGIRSFHAADLNFNERYTLFYMEMARLNNDQPLTLARDSLIKFNASIASKYKSGIGLKYLDDFINGDILETTIKEFIAQNKLKQISSNEFEKLLKENTNKDIDWFFEDYLDSRKKIDFKIKKVEEKNDSLRIVIKNKRNNSMPVSLFKIRNDTIISKEWIEGIDSEKEIIVPKDGASRLVLNYDQTVPEFNLRDNWKSLEAPFFNNKPLQLRLFKDFEDPNYNQVFLMPLVEFNNIYDGLTLGAKFYNKTILRKAFNYRISPQYATKSQTFTGGGTVFYIQNFENRDLYAATYGFSGKYNAIGPDAFVTVLAPNVSFSFRDNNDFRSNHQRYLNFRYLNIQRNIGPEAQIVQEEPDYGVFNVRYIDSDNNLIDFSRWSTDLQFAKQFGKLSLNYEYRKLSESNRQFNFRFFAGAFLYNNTALDSDYFSFALDRPTDYLFDYNYLGRAEASGIFSQQIIIAEGGFKSQLPTEFADEWMTTINSSYSIWRYIEMYGDIGIVKSKSERAEFVYDSGIRLNLVPDYFELFFPVYSSLGWEIAQDNYDQKIRFKVTIDPQILLGLFRRKWY